MPKEVRSVAGYHHDPKRKAANYLRETCKNHGVPNTFFGNEAREIIDEIIQANFTTGQMYLVARLVENVIRAVLHVEVQQTNIEVQRECAAKADILSTWLGNSPEGAPWAEMTEEENNPDHYYINLYSSGTRDTLVDNCPKPIAEVLTVALNAASKYMRKP